MRRFYRFVVSIRCAIMLLVIISIASCIGTLVPQGMPDEAIYEQYGIESFVAKVITLMDLNDVYHALWFRVILVALAINIILCTVERLTGTLRIWSHVEKNISSERLKKFSLFESIISQKSFDETIAECEQCVRGTFGGKRIILKHDAECWGVSFCKGKLSLFTAYGLHASILIILFGALVGSLFGFKGVMNIAEGSTENTVRLLREEKAIKLPYRVRCEKFVVEFYPQGTPKEYRSDIVILNGEKEVTRARLRVNDPFTYDGVTFYQASYGSILQEAHVAFVEEGGHKAYRVVLKPGDYVPVGNGEIRARLVDFREDFSGLGPALGIVLAVPGRDEVGSWILAKFPKFHGNKILNYRVIVEDFKTKYYTGLQVKRDPGVGIVIFGFCAFVVFLFTMFSWSYKRIWVVVEPKNLGSMVFIAGRAYKNTLSFEAEFRKLTRELNERLSEYKEVPKKDE